jgi:hypothetical protein
MFRTSEVKTPFRKEGDFVEIKRIKIGIIYLNKE